MLLVYLILIVIVPLTAILLLLWLITKKSIFGKIVGFLWLGLISLIILFCVLSVFTSKKEIDKNDIYGEYVIDRNKCPGKQANWQYNHYRYKISEDNKIFFYITDKDKIIKTIEGKVEIKEGYASPRLEIIFDEPFHITAYNPTLYREVWSFYYVFYSDKFDNMFFTKGNWKSID